MTLCFYIVVGLFMSPSRTPRYALSDVTQQQNMASPFPVLTNIEADLDRAPMLVDETEAFALEPIDVTAIGQYVISDRIMAGDDFYKSAGLCDIYVSIDLQHVLLLTANWGTLES